MQRQDAKTCLSHIIKKKVPIDMHQAMVRTVSVEEIQAALKSIKGDKVPGPDGFCSSFFQKNWEVVGQDLVDAVLHFFDKGFILKQWNATALTLIPKVSSPSSVRDYRPIALLQCGL